MCPRASRARSDPMYRNPEPKYSSPNISTHGAGGLRRPRASTTTGPEDSKDKEKRSRRNEKRHEEKHKKSTIKAQKKSTKKTDKESEPEEESLQNKREYTPPLSLKSSPKG